PTVLGDRIAQRILDLAGAELVVVAPTEPALLGEAHRPAGLDLVDLAAGPRLADVRDAVAPLHRRLLVDVAHLVVVLVELQLHAEHLAEAVREEDPVPLRVDDPPFGDEIAAVLRAVTDLPGRGVAAQA